MTVTSHIFSIGVVSTVVGVLALIKPIHGANATRDPCAILASSISHGSGVVINSQYAACLGSFPYNPFRGKKTIASLLKAIPFYPYLDVAMNNPDPNLPGKVDLRKGLALILATPWKRELDFHTALLTLFRSLNDGHTRYQSTCFESFPVSTSFLFSKYYVASRGKEIVYLAPVMGTSVSAVDAETEKSLKLKLKDYAKAEVLAIEGIDPVSFITDWADRNVGRYRDKSARVNAAFSRPLYTTNGLSYSYGDFSQRVLPEVKDFLQLTIQRNGKMETIKAPWLIDMSSSNFLNGTQFYYNYCTSVGFPIGELRAARRPFLQRKHMATLPQPLWRQSKLLKKQAAVDSGMKTLFDSFMKVFLLPDGITSVLVIPDFTGRSVESWVMDLTTAAGILKRYKVQRLILDLSNNPGGDVTLADRLLQTLFPGQFSRYPLEFAAPLLAQEMVTRNKIFKSDFSDYYFGGYADLAGNNYSGANQFFFPVTRRVTNGVSNPFSKRFTLAMAKLNTSTAPLFPAKQLLVLTNGNCASACATVTYNLYERMGVRHVVIGGILNKPMAFSSLLIGYMLDLQSLVDYDLSPLNFSNDVRAPQPFPYEFVQSFTFPMAQAFCLRNSTIPGDFVFLAGQVSIPYTNVTAWNFLKLWQQVALHF